MDLKPCKVCELSVEIPFPSLLLGRPSTLLLAEDVGGIKILLCLIKVSKLNIYWQLRTNVSITRDSMLILMSCFFLYRGEIESWKFIVENLYMEQKSFLYLKLLQTCSFKTHCTFYYFCELVTLIISR